MNNLEDKKSPADDMWVENELSAIEARVAKKSKDKLKAEDIIRIVHKSGALLFHDQYNDSYIAFNGDGTSISKIDSKVTKTWLSHYIYKNYKEAISTSLMNQVLLALAGHAKFEGEQHQLEVRSVNYADSLWYDLGKSAVWIIENGWEVVDEPPIIFKRFAHHEQQVMPKSGGDIRLLLKYINLTDELEQLLFLVYVVSAFIPGFPHPVLILHGAQGAGKTTPMKVMKELIDPSQMKNGSSMPKYPEALVQMLSHHSFLFFDNLSAMPEWFSDNLAKACTGDSFSKRELYTNDDDVIYHIQITIALNGINQVVYKSDLLDRSILLNLERISPEMRKEDQVFWTEFEQERPLILGAIFDVLAKALTIYPTLKLSKLPRMADFARWGCAIAEASGFKTADFLKAYSQNIARQHDEAIEANPVAQAIVELMKDRDNWIGTSSQLLDELNQIAENLNLANSNSWPKNATRIGKAINILVPNLLAKGIELNRSRSKERLITLTKTSNSTVASDVTDDTKNSNNSSNDTADTNDTKNTVPETEDSFNKDLIANMDRSLGQVELLDDPFDH